MKHSLRLKLLALATMIFWAAFAVAQGVVTGSISATLEDPQGALVGGAKVTAKHLATNREFATETTAAGIVSLRSLPPGTYDVRIEAPQFRTFESKGVEVAVGSDTSLGFVRLVIGSSSETMTVEGTAPLVEATTQNVTETFDSKKVESLPVNTNIDSLALFMPGVASSGDTNFANKNGSGLVINGQRGRSINFEIDGQNNNDNGPGGPTFFFGNQDAISEVQVVTNYSAEYGRTMGGVVNYVTKQGTNQIHGTAYEFWTGDTFASLANQQKSPLFGFCTPGQSPSSGCTLPVVPRFVDNRFGGTLGGPIKKNKMWFFGSTNLERIRTGAQPSSTAPGLVPTPTGIQQLASAFPSSPAANLYGSVGPSSVAAGNPTYSNIQNVFVTTTKASSGGYIDCSVSPTPTGCFPIQMGSVRRFIPSPADDYEATGRLDFKLTGKDNFFGRYLFQKAPADGICICDSIAVGDWQSIYFKSQEIGLDWAHNSSNTFVNQVRLSYTRALTYFVEASRPGCTIANPLNCPPEIIMAGAAPQDVVSFGMVPIFPQGRTINVYQLQDNASWLKGRHTIKIGGEVDQQRSPELFLPWNDSGYIFGSFNDLVANNPEVVEFSEGNPKFPFHENDVSVYFQDDWRIKDNLTLNLGLRWDWFQQAFNVLHERTVADQTGSSPLWSSSLPLGQTTLPAIPQALHNFAPVLGFAWTPHIMRNLLGEDKTVVRGGFRISFDPVFYGMFLTVATTAPTVNFQQFFAPLPSSGFTGAAIGAFLQPFVSGGDPGTASQTTVSPNFHNPYTEQWTFGVQRWINSKIAAEVRYLGNHTVGNFQFVNANPALAPLIAAGFQSLIPSGLKPCTTSGALGTPAGYVDCNRTHVSEFNNGAFSNYNSLQSELRIGQWHGLTATASYTWSHTIDNTSEVFSTAVGGNTLAQAQNPFDTSAGERGNSGIDFPNAVGVALSYELPSYKAQQGFLGHLLGGWQMNTSYRYSSGQPYTVIQRYPALGSLCDPTETMDTSHDACRPIVSDAAAPMASVGICTNPSAADCGITNFVTGNATSMSAVHWIINDPNAAAFFHSPFKGVGRNTLRGQPLTPVNLGVFKNTRIGERLTAQFQAIAFNVFNTQFLGNPDPVVQDAANGVPAHFGSLAYNSNGGSTNTANATYDGIGVRNLMFGLKLIF